MEHVSNYYSIIPHLVEYFAFAKAGPYHPMQVREDLSISKSYWRTAVKAFVYPEGSEGRTALASVGVTIIPESLRRCPSGMVMTNSLFLKSDDA